MGKRGKRFDFQLRPLTTAQKAIVLPVMVVIGGLAVAAAIFTIVIMPVIDPASQRGVGADGFSAYIENGTDLGVGKVVTKADVITALGGKSKAISSVNTSSVFNYNGDRSQTQTFNFVRPDNINASLYVDATLFKSSQSMQNEDILAGTALARIINGHSAYYMHAQTLGAAREYRLVVVDHLTAYKFVIDQPVNNIKISEVSAVVVLLNLAQKAKL